MARATYIRISTSKQNPATQIKRSIGETYIDEIKGTVPFAKRPSGKRLMGDIATGKIKNVFVLRIDRMGRNAFDIMETVEFFKAEKCQLNVTSLGLSLFEDGKINRMFMLMISIYSQLAEQQREEIKERTAEGIEDAKDRGVYKGRAKGTTEEATKFLSKHPDIINCLNSGMSLNKTKETTGKSKPTVIKVKKLLKN
jgi:DNA invertase Pin-like site-specific DNA recombinase